LTPIAKEVCDGVRFDFREMKWKGMTLEYIGWLEKTYPDADIKATLDGLTNWLHNNRNQKKAHKKDWHKFLMTNLRRAQIKAVFS